MTSWMLCLFFLASMDCMGQNSETGGRAKAKEVANLAVEKLVEGSYEKVTQLFDSSLHSALSAAGLKDAWIGATAGLGAFIEYHNVLTRPTPSGDSLSFALHFEKGSLLLRAVVNDQDQLSGLWLADQENVEWHLPSYAHPDRYEARHVVVGEKGPFPLEAELLVPLKSAKFPGVVFVHGSGPHDKDETIGGRKPFADLAVGLASRGIAVLRYDKRTKAYHKAVLENITVREEVIEDAVSAIALLRSCDGIDTARIFVLGHSFGGTLLPLIHDAEPKLAGLIMMAALATPLEDAILKQYERLVAADGAGEELQKQLEELRTQCCNVKSATLAPDTPRDRLPLRVPASYWLSLRSYHPLALVPHMATHFLVVQGGLDANVTQEDFDLWKRALANNARATFLHYPSLNHLFMADALTPGTDGGDREHVAEEVVEDVARWILSSLETAGRPGT